MATGTFVGVVKVKKLETGLVLDHLVGPVLSRGSFQVDEASLRERRDCGQGSGRGTVAGCEVGGRLWVASESCRKRQGADCPLGPAADT